MNDNDTRLYTCGFHTFKQPKVHVTTEIRYQCKRCGVYVSKEYKEAYEQGIEDAKLRYCDDDC